MDDLKNSLYIFCECQTKLGWKKILTQQRQPKKQMINYIERHPKSMLLTAVDGTEIIDIVNKCEKQDVHCL